MTHRRPDALIEEVRTHSIIGAFFEVYNTLDYGYLESVYVAALTLELRQRGHDVVREATIRVLYKGVEIAWQRVDLLVDNAVICEVKSTPKIAATVSRQLQNYLRATRIEVGLLLHFGLEPRFYRLIATNDGPALEEVAADPEQPGDSAGP